MKKRILYVVAGLVVVIVAGLVILAFSLGYVVKRGVETIGPRATKVEVTLKGAEVWLWDGRAEINGFVLGNPPGCNTTNAVAVDKVSVSLNPGSVFSHKLVVKSIAVKNAVITLEGGLNDNNLTTIEKNLNDYLGTSPKSGATPSAAPSSPAQSEKKIEVDDLAIVGAKVQVHSILTGGQTLTLPIPDIHLTDLGTGPDGITPAEVAQKALHAVLTSATQEAVKNVGSLSKGAVGGAKKAVESIKGLFH